MKRNYKLPPTYHLGSPGCACFLEPPGHPRYFVQSIYTQHGNSPSRGPQYFFEGSGFDSIEEVDTYFKPLPYDHPRVKAWEAYAYAYFRNSYSKDGTSRCLTDSITVEPKETVFTKSSPDKFTTTPQPPEHHLAYLLVKKYYPEAKPRLDLIANPPAWGRGGVGTWWERLNEKPTPETCPGDRVGKHPVNGSWCQVCGWSSSSL